MFFCDPKCQKVTVIVIASIFFIFGAILTIFHSSIYNSLLRNQLILTNSSKTYKIWKNIPIPIYFEIYLYNWTNSEQVLQDNKIKPIFQECGPYTFHESHIRVNFKWHENSTITYQQKKIWKYIPERSKGSLNDVITNLNPIIASVGYFVKDKTWIVKKAVNLLLKEKEKSLTVTSTVEKLLWFGIDDEMLTALTKLNISNIPYDKFAWFYQRNNSETYDGIFNMYTGEKNLNMLGIIEKWNNVHKTPYFGEYCNYVNGTSGELWPPIGKNLSVSLFIPDICSSLNLNYKGVDTFLGLEGQSYVAERYLLDNGTDFPEMKCFNGDKIFPSGVRDISKCKFGAPAFVSYPHFYLADPFYRDSIIGMKPNKDLHETTLSIEPNTGIPLNVRAQLQINLLISPIEEISLLKNIKETFVPMLWFRESVMITPELANEAKLVLILPNIFIYTGSGLIGLSLLLFAVFAFVTFKKGWKGSEGELLVHEE